VTDGYDPTVYLDHNETSNIKIKEIVGKSLGQVYKLLRRVLRKSEIPTREENLKLLYWPSPETFG
jgi:hypothetical protein